MTVREFDKVNANQHEIALNHEIDTLLRDHSTDPDDNESSLIDDVGFAQGFDQSIGNNCSSAPRPYESGKGKSRNRETKQGMAKLVGKLEKFLDLSKKKQRKKHSRLLKIIDKLEKKQDCLQAEIRQEPDSKRYHNLIRKLDVISELIEKAKLKDCSD